MAACQRSAMADRSMRGLSRGNPSENPSAGDGDLNPKFLPFPQEYPSAVGVL